MVRLLASLLLAPVLLAASACDPVAKQVGEGRQDSVAATTPDSLAAGVGAAAGEDGSDHDVPAGHAATSHAAAGGEGQALLPIMQRLGSEMTALTYALMTDDYESVTRSAAAIAQHAPISAEELERIHAVLGPDMAVFAAVDESVHVASVRLHDAARARQPALIVERLGEVQRGCVSCHAQFRERLRTARGGQ